MHAPTKLPSYRLHKARNQAVVTLSGRDVYLGPYGTQASRDNYDRAIGEWLAAGRTAPGMQGEAGFTILALIDGFTENETVPASHAHEFQTVMKALLRLHGESLVADFGPLNLKGVRQLWINQKLTRKTINERVDKLRRIFRWGVSEQKVSPTVLQALEAVDSLKAGKTAARESVDVESVDAGHVEAIAKAMPKMLAAMVRLQLKTGMRAKEMCTLRTCDLDMRGPVWIYRPEHHKTQHMGKTREVAIGPEGIELLQPWLLPDLQAYIFSPARAEAERRAAMHGARITPLSCGNRPGKRSPGGRPPGRSIRRLGPYYSTSQYRRAIARVIERLYPPPDKLARAIGETDTEWRIRLGPELWSDLLAWRKKQRWTPNQLRHTFGQKVRDMFDPDHVQSSLGHANVKTSEIYAKVRRDKAIEVAAAIG